MGWIFNFVHERISENMLERVEKNFSKSDKSFKRPTNFVSRKFTNLITLETKHNLDVKNILNYWLVGAGWICWFWAAASLPGLVFLATPPQIPIHFPLFTFFSLWLCFDFSLRWLGPFVAQFHGSSIPCLGDVPFKKRKKSET